MNIRHTNTHRTADIPAHIFESFLVIVRERPLLAGSLWFGVFLILLAFSWVLGIIPELDTDIPTEETSSEAVRVAETYVSANPTRIIIDSIDVDSAILTPASRSIEVLDQALLEGVVHYPGSARPGEQGNVFLFGHSTGFRVVNNEAFKVFNNLKHLTENEVIRLQTGDREYLYRVTRVSLVNADEALVDLSPTGNRLTLSTCNSFGAEQERYVVEAEFVGDYPIAG